MLARSVIEPTVAIDAGSIVELYQTNGSFIGRGIYNPSSRIRVRLYQWDPQETLDAAWIQLQLRRALDMRKSWMRAHQDLDALRIVNSEGDGLSGLIVDKFGDYLVVQITALSMVQWQDAIVDWLMENLSPSGVHLRIDSQAGANEGMENSEAWVHGDPPSNEIEIAEQGIRIQVDLAASQKTGYYLDQRTNRSVAAGWMDNGRLLDVCCYQGGFSMAAAKTGNPTQIVAVDSSQRALAQAAKNAEANDISNIEFVQSDCFDFLEQAVQAGGEPYQTIVLDPPRMASKKQQMQSALRAYHRLNLSAVHLLKPGGILVTCSCSGRVKRTDFAGILSSVAKRSRRRIQILEARGADFDHPVDANCPESEYLKCFVCRVI